MDSVFDTGSGGLHLSSPAVALPCGIAQHSLAALGLRMEEPVEVERFGPRIPLANVMVAGRPAKVLCEWKADRLCSLHLRFADWDSPASRQPWSLLQDFLRQQLGAANSLYRYDYAWGTIDVRWYPKTDRKDIVLCWQPERLLDRATLLLATERFEAALARHPEDERCAKMLSHFGKQYFAEVRDGRILMPVSQAPSSRYFGEGELRDRPDVEEAYWAWSAALNPLPTSTSRRAG